MIDAPVITFLSDYGVKDEFVGICHAVIADKCPAARVIDLTHGVPRHDVRAGGLILAAALPYLPHGVHLAVVDPDVGAERRAVALLLADERILVGPDNGLLWGAAQRAGGVAQALDIARSRFRLEPVSATFHGRDIFAPVAGQLAAGVPFEEVGAPVDPAQLVALELPRPRREDGVLIAHALYVDRFGNVQLDVRHEDLADSGLKLGRRLVLESSSGIAGSAHYVRTFADVDPGELLVYEDASRSLAVAVAHGDAAARLKLEVDCELRIRPA
ncbi:MAG: SAM-dependent chlorinase/fluorinase [Solirubrobacterales bacterium]|nr:SAM-dependent chlorinase/fluorinase [Solirubrobacterales bacterium]